VHDKNAGDVVLQRLAERGVPGGALDSQPGPATFALASRASAWACVASCVCKIKRQRSFIVTAPARRARGGQVVVVGFQAPMARKGTTPGWGWPK
jgi:hypothetical protein